MFSIINAKSVKPVTENSLKLSRVIINIVLISSEWNEKLIIDEQLPTEAGPIVSSAILYTSQIDLLKSKSGHHSLINSQDFRSAT